MKLKILYSVLTVALIAAAVSFSNRSSLAASAGQRAQGAKVCSDPSVTCTTSMTFEPYDLAFRVPANAGISETGLFYAIILKSVRHGDSDCDRFVSEDERLAAQEMFPHQKVFTSRCGNPGGLFYTNVAQNTEFMAVYAGETKAQADQVLAMVRATGKFPGANLRQMRAGFNGT